MAHLGLNSEFTHRERERGDLGFILVGLRVETQGFPGSLFIGEFKT